MKMFKSLAMGASVLSIASMANADVTFHLTGSTAFRAATVTAINALVGSPTEYDNAAVTSANNIAWSGSNATFGNFKIYGSWSGSTGGLQVNSGNLAVGFVPDSQITSGLNTTDYRAVGNGGTFVVPDADMADSYQSTTPWNGVVRTIISGSAQNHTYVDLSAGDNQLAIVTFKFMASAGFPGVSNTSTNLSSYSMAPNHFRALFGNTKGHMPLALITGNSSDENTVLFATGRDFDSGTRTDTLTETGYGASNHVFQWAPIVTDTTTNPITVTTQALYPITTIDGISTGALGNGGESSGGTLRARLNYQIGSSVYTTGTEGGGSSVTGAYYITYLGTADSSSVLPPNGHAVELQYNGVAYSDTAAEEGAYTFWNIEHLYTNPGIAAGPASFASALVTQIQGEAESQLSHAGLPLGVMNVSRQTDGGTITANYF